MPGCDTCASSAASRENRSASAFRVSCRTFIATGWLVCRSLPLKTVPIPPDATSASSRNWPPITSGLCTLATIPWVHGAIEIRLKMRKVLCLLRFLSRSGMAADERKKGRAKDHPTDPSRRRFLKGVGLVGAGAAIADRLAIEPAEAEAAAGGAADGKVKVALQINGQKRQLALEPRTTLLSAMRDHLDPAVTGPKLVCDHGTCGACTVMLEGKPVYSCLLLAVDAAGRAVTTVEGLGSPGKMSALQQAFVEKDATMCGFCTSGFVVSVSAYLKANPKPTLDQLRDACHGNFCRCGTYPKVFAAGMAASGPPHASLQGDENAGKGI